MNPITTGAYPERRAAPSEVVRPTAAKATTSSSEAADVNSSTRSVPTAPDAASRSPTVLAIAMARKPSTNTGNERRSKEARLVPGPDEAPGFVHAAPP